MDTYVLVQGLWHSGDLLKEVAGIIEAEWHKVYTPTLAGNNPQDDKAVGLNVAIQSLVSYFETNNITNCILIGHSYGGMVMAGAFVKLGAERIKRLVFWNTFVPNPGECLNDMVPENYVELFDAIAQEDGSMLLTYPIW